MPISFYDWFNLNYPGDFDKPKEVEPVRPAQVPRFIPPFVYTDVYGTPMHPDEFKASQRLWSGTTWEDPFGQVNPFDAAGNLTEEAVAAGYTPNIVWPGPGYRGANTYQF